MSPKTPWSYHRRLQHKFIKHSICELFTIIFHQVVWSVQLVPAIKKLDQVYHRSLASTMFYFDHWLVSADSLSIFSNHERTFVLLKENSVSEFLDGPIPMHRLHHDKLMVHKNLGKLPFEQRSFKKPNCLQSLERVNPFKFAHFPGQEIRR